MKVRVSWLHADQAKTTVYDADSYQVHDGVLQVYKGDKQVGTVFSPQEAAIVSDEEADQSSMTMAAPLVGAASPEVSATPTGSTGAASRTIVRGPIHLPDPGTQQ